MNKQQIEIGMKIKNVIGCENMEDCVYKHEMDGHIYDLREEENENWVSEGKYEYRKYVCEILEDNNPTGVYLSQSQSRSGSYYTDWYYYYEKPEIVEKYEQIIKVTKYKSIKRD